MNGPAITLAEAARRAGVSATTVRRWAVAGKLAGAERTPDGSWSIPLAALVAAGHLDRVTPAPMLDGSQAGVSPVTASASGSAPRESTARQLHQLAAVVEELRADREELRRDREELRRTVEVLTNALAEMSRRLPAGPSPATDGSQAGVSFPTLGNSTTSSTPPPRPRLVDRLRRRWS